MQNVMERYQTFRQVVDDITLMNNRFMNKVFDGNIPATQRMLRVILKYEKLLIEENILKVDKSHGCHASGGLFTFTKLFGNTACATSSKRRIIDESLKIRGLYEEKISIFTFARAGLSVGAGRNFIRFVRITV